MRGMHKLGRAAPAAVACAKNANTELGGADILLEHNQALRREHQRPPHKAPDVDPRIWPELSIHESQIQRLAAPENAVPALRFLTHLRLAGRECAVPDSWSGLPLRILG
jgi:hypothetical protein